MIAAASREPLNPGSSPHHAIEMLKFIGRKFDSMSSDGQAAVIISFFVIVALLSALGMMAFSAYNESQSFNRITTGPHVTVWDAVWLDLRVEACK